MTIQHEWKCKRCGQSYYGRTKPPKPGQFVFRAIICSKCKVPAVPTGNTRKHYSLRELL